MAEEHHFVGGEGALWVQRDGPNTEPVYLGCHQLGDIDIPEGDIELMYCPDESAPSTFKVVGSVQGAAGAATTSITTDLTENADELEYVKKCEFTLYANMSKTGRKDLFTNFDRVIAMSGVRITNRGLSNLVARTAEDNARTEQTYDVSMESVIRIIEPSITRSTITETASINDISFCNSELCRTSDQIAKDICTDGFAATDAGTGSPSATAQVLVTSDGSSWAASGADPFDAGEDISAIECFEQGRDTVRVIVARGTTDAGAAAEIAYSDDDGDTWTNVDVGSINGEFAPSRFSLYVLNRNHIWLGTDGGYIYYSNDAGLTWTAQESASIQSGNWNAIKMVDRNVGWAVGASNSIARTVDGGTNWSTVTGPVARAGDNAISLHVFDRNRAWVGYDSGHMYYTLDAGATWTLRSFTGSGVGEVRDVKFMNELMGFMLSDNASPVGTVLWTIDGGFTWSTMTTPTNAGLNALWLCDAWTFFVVGEAQGGTGFLAKATV